MPSGMGPACDRVFYRMIREQSLMIRQTEEPTVNFTSTYEFHYRCVGISPPPDAKRGDLRTVAAQIKQLDRRQQELINRRCGFNILPLAQASRHAASSRNNLCFCGSGKRFKHCHGMFGAG
jgi:hypothetical protein